MRYVSDIPGRFYRTEEKAPSASQLWNQIVENGMSSMIEYNRNVLSKSIGGTVSTIILALLLIGTFACIFLKNGQLTAIFIASFLIVMCLSILIVRDPSKTERELKQIRFVVAVFLGVIVIASALVALGITGIMKFSVTTYCLIAAGVCLLAAIIIGVWMYFALYKKNSEYSYTGTAVVVGYEDKLIFARKQIYRDVLTTPVYAINYGGSQYLVYGDREYRIGGNGYAIPHIGSTQRVSFNPFDPYECHFGGQPSVPSILKGIVAVFIIAALALVFTGIAMS